MTSEREAAFEAAFETALAASPGFNDTNSAPLDVGSLGAAGVCFPPNMMFTLQANLVSNRTENPVS